MENFNEMHKLFAKVATDFLRFYGLVAKDAVAKNWDPELSLLQNIDKEINSHDCGLAALAMAIKLYHSSPKIGHEFLDIGNNENHWYISWWNGIAADNTLYWDTSVALLPPTENATSLRGYREGCVLDEDDIEDATYAILNNDGYGQAILYQWLHLSCPDVEYETTGDDTTDLINLIRAIFDNPFMFAGAFPNSENNDCIYSNRDKVRA
jgi:hypothetical protein